MLAPSSTGSTSNPSDAPRDPESSRIEDALATHVRRCFNDAQNTRRQSGIDEMMLRCLRAKKCEYDPDDLKLVGANNIYIGIAALKARAAESWINDILLNSIDQPWTLSPTPVPSLSPKQRELVIDQLEQLFYASGQKVNDDLRNAAAKLKYDALLKANVLAEKATQNMSKLIADQLLEGGWRSAFAAFVSDLTVFPNAVLRSPVYVKTSRLVWNGESLVAKNEPIPTVRRVNPLDVFPSRDSTTTQDGEFIIVRERTSAATLYQCIGLPGFNEAAVRKVLDDYGSVGVEENLTGDAERARLEDKASPLERTSFLDTLIMNGRVRGDLLVGNGVLVKDPQAYYEVEIWTIRDITVKAVLNPYPTGVRPLHTTSFVKRPGSFWGDSTIGLVLEPQRMCNAAARSIARNMAYSSGPMGECEVERMLDGEAITEMAPYRIYGVNADVTGGGQAALRFVQFPNVVPQLQGVFDQYSKIADDLSGVPSYVIGQPQVAGAGRTLGGLSMLMGNAAKGIKNSLLNVDRDVIESVVGFLFVANMLTSTDPGIKADAQVLARGASGLLQRELAQTRTIEILQLLTPYAQAGVIPKDGLEVLLREILKPAGLPVDQIIPDPGQNQQLGVLGGLLQPGGMGRAMARGSSDAPNLPAQSQPGPAEPPHPVPVNNPTGA